MNYSFSFKNYAFSLLLLLAIITGGLVGHFIGSSVHYLKPIGDIFLNLLYTAIVPLIFFSISSTIANTKSLSRLGTILGAMLLVFLLASSVASIYGLLVVCFFPPAQGVNLALTMPPKIADINLSEQLVNIFTVPEFSQLFSHQHILALVLFSLLIGMTLVHDSEEALFFKQFLRSGEFVFNRFFNLIMCLAPLGFFAYFAVLVNQLGPQLLQSYVRVGILYYVCAATYFLVIYSLLAFIAGKKKGFRLFWAQVMLPAMTALATCSSAASIPANLMATRKMQVPAEISDTVIPIGSLIHKEGSVIGGIFKIAFLFGVFQLDFTSANVLLTALGVSLLVGTVMGAIPSGGMLGELLILSVYGFPPSTLIVIAAISIIIDPIATLLNVTGNSVASLLVARLTTNKPPTSPIV